MKENQDIEFKGSWRDEYIKWICGFANAKGGVIYIGLNDSGEVIGIDNAKKLLEDIPNKVRDVSGVLVDVRMLTESSKEYLEITVESYPYPVSYKSRYFYRTGSSKQELKGAALDKFLLRKQGKTWDGVPVPHVSADDLDGRAIELFESKANKKKRIEVDITNESRSSLLEKLHLVEGDYLKRAAVLLFHSDCERYITGSYIKIGYFKSDSELLYQDRVEGSILEQVDKTMDLIFTKYLKAAIDYEGIQRVESFPLSELAFREALTNAVVHKNYGGHTPIQISVYDDKLMIWNIGELPEEWTIETLTHKHASMPCNPAVANVFFLSGLIESWGRGIEKIIYESEKFNGITPKFRYDNGLWVEFDFNQVEERGGEKLGNDLGNRLGKKLTKNREKIIALMRENPTITIVELSNIISISKTAIEENISKLKEMHFIKRIGGTRGYWEVIDPHQGGAV